MNSNVIELFCVSIGAVATILVGVSRIANSMIDRKLGAFEISLVRRINGTYVRSEEFEAWLEQRTQEREHMYELLKELKEGLEYIRRRQEENNHKR